MAAVLCTSQKCSNIQPVRQISTDLKLVSGSQWLWGLRPVYSITCWAAAKEHLE